MRRLHHFAHDKFSNNGSEAPCSTEVGGPENLVVEHPVHVPEVTYLQDDEYEGKLQ